MDFEKEEEAMVLNGDEYGDVADKDLATIKMMEMPMKTMTMTGRMFKTLFTLPAVLLLRQMTSRDSSFCVGFGMMNILTPVTSGQVSCLLGIVPVVIAWIYSEFLEYKKNSISSTISRRSEIGFDGVKEEDTTVLLEEGGLQPSSRIAQTASYSNNIFRFLLMEESFLTENRLVLRAISEFGLVLAYFFLCDRTDFFGTSKKSYNRDIFLFLYFLLVVVAAMTSLKRGHGHSTITGKSILYVNRHQTEEWKGWMQALFLLYHYFAAKEIYNSIRVLVAAYVWLTGFGNFSYYYHVQKDFSFARFTQMMWRINFLVFFCCVVLNNSYTLYYICPMHTVFTLMIYVVLGIFNKYNEIGGVIAVKIFACFLVVVLIWEVPGVFDIVWSPFVFLLGYVNPDPSKSELPPLHEWHFRSGLDRYMWIVGMIFGYYHPTVERWMEKLEKMEVKIRISIKAGVIIVCLAGGYLWFEYIYKLEKFSYNKYHPYTSWIPVTIYISLRNITQSARSYSLTLFGWLGKITLETYISQIHVWLRSNSPNAQPKFLLSLIPDYPFLNFMLTTFVYIAISYRLFAVTNTIKMAILPSKDNRSLVHNIVTAAVVASVLYSLSFAFLSLSQKL